ncbi:MAG TPA: chromosome segregation protein SMC, partial [Thermoplasmata archaeon]|nr:chromosome segregation protein SMC [Thermoplasmata archaeon]
MHLKAIEVENFKSFAGRLKIPLLPGYTGVTGPNGSGKSNISDAILFVLGPKSSRALRAGKQTDLIYNGGQNGKPSKECTVTLLFANRDRTFPVDADEVALTRVIRKSPTDPDGYSSSFYLNERRSSLTEFETLLAHARISADGYNIVQQGDITRIVEVGAIERRRILENISGIARFDADIERAVKKMGEVEIDLGALRVRLDEVKRQLATLEDDRKKAIEWKEIHDRLTLADAQLKWRQAETHREDLDAIDAQIAKAEEEKSRLEGKQKELESESASLQQQLESQSLKVQEALGKEYGERKARLDDLRLEYGRAENDIDNCDAMLESLSAEARDLTTTLKRTSKTVDANRKDLAEAETRLAKLSAAEKGLQDAIHELTKRAEKTTSGVKEKREELQGVQERLAKSGAELRDAVIERDRVKDKIERARAALAQAEHEHEDAKFAVKDLDWRIKEVAGGAKKLDAERKKIVDEFNELRALDKKIDEELSRLQAEYARIGRDYQMVSAQLSGGQRGDVTAMAVGAVMEARDKGEIKGIHGTVAELLRYDPEYEVAISLAGGARLNAVLVDTDEIAAQCISLLKRTDRGRAIFLPLNKMMGSQPRGKAMMLEKRTGVRGFALHIVEYDAKYERAMAYVFGETLVCETLNVAREIMGGVRLVTLQGELVEPSGAMVGGSAPRSAAPARAQLNALQTKLREAGEQIELKNGNQQKLRAKLREIEDKLRVLNSQSAEDPESLRRHLEEEKKRLQAKAESADSLAKEIAADEKSFERAEKSASNLEAEVKGLEASLDALNSSLGDMMPEELQSQVSTRREEQATTLRELSEVKGALESARASLEASEREKAGLEERVETNRQKQAETKERAERADAIIGEHRKELERLKSLVEGAEEDQRKLVTERDSIQQKFNDLEVERGKVATLIDTKTDRAVDLKVKREQKSLELKEAEAVVEACPVKFEGSVPSARELSQTISECQAKLHVIGDVNQKAIEDFDVQQGRHDEMISELARLETEKSELEKVRGELESRKKAELLTIFAEIDKNFREVYTVLSDGGEAHLELEKPETPFEGGLMLIAKPKGKKVSRLELLSGGEKSLTALAFIFAIQRFDPSPFYVLDEVDMFLDAINAENVAKAVKANSGTAQFIQVSLRQCTLQYPNHLIGVTQREGRSTIIMKQNLSEVLAETGAAKDAEKAEKR